MNNTVVVSVALLRSAAGGARCAADGAGGSLGLFLSLLLLTGATYTRSGHVVSPDIDGKVLQNIGVDGTLLRLLLSLAQGVVVVLSVVIDDALANLRDVENAVQQVSGPVGVELGVGDGVAQAADGGEGLADVEG